MIRLLQPHVPELGFTSRTSKQMEWQRERYKGFCSDWENERRGSKPDGEGVLTFDEVNVRFGLLLNAASEVTEGWVLSTEQLHNFEDIYQHLTTADPPPCRYVMASMWRCLDSSFQCLGPIMASPGGLKAAGVHKFVWRCIEEFSHFGFSTAAAVCDGATPNLRFLKMNCTIDTDPDNLVIQPWVYNRFTGRLLFILFDPPHGLKTKRNSYASSREEKNSPRHYTIWGDLLRTEINRVLQERNLPHLYTGAASTTPPAPNNAPASAPAPASSSEPQPPVSMAPALASASPPPPPAATADQTSEAATATAKKNQERVKFGYNELLKVFGYLEGLRKGGFAPPATDLTHLAVFLDKWTKMRVHLAKAWFTHRTVAFLVDHVVKLHPDDLPLQAILVFFDAVQAIDLDFFMSKKGVEDITDPIVVNLISGLKFFLAWWDDIRTTAGPKSAQARHCMANVTMVEMLVTGFGTLEFMKYRFAYFPGRKVYPRRLSQSALEGTFGYCRSLSPGGMTLPSFRRAIGVITFLGEGEVAAREEVYLHGK
jgi:hypothetical protein